MKKIITASFIVALLAGCSGMHREYTNTPYDGRTAGEGTAVYGTHDSGAAKIESHGQRK